MGRKKDIKIILDTYGNYLGMEKGCIVLRDKKGNESKYPLIENTVSEIVLNSGNMVSTGLLCSMGFWGTDVLIATRNGKPIAMLKSLDDDCHVETRISQYRALKNGKGCYIAKRLVEGKIEGQKNLLIKYGLEANDTISQKVREIHEPRLSILRRKLLGLEGKFGRYYFKQVFRLFPEQISPMYRSSYRAYDGVNNMFNLAYRILFWKCYRALVQARAHINDIFEAISGSMLQMREIISELKGGLLYLAREMGELKKLENMENKIELLEAEMKKKNKMIEGIEQHIEDRKRAIKKQMKEAEEKFKKYAI